MLLQIAVVAVVVMWVCRPSRKAQGDAHLACAPCPGSGLSTDRRADAICAAIRRIDAQRAFPEVRTDLVLSANEFALCDTLASLYESPECAADRGRLVVTSRRFVFLGSVRTIAIDLAGMLDMQENDGILVVHADTLHAPVLFGVEGIDTGLLLLLARLCREGAPDGRFLPPGVRLEAMAGPGGFVGVGVRYQDTVPPSG